MAAVNNFDIHSLSNNPLYNFLHKFNADNSQEGNFFGNFNESPYELNTFDCEYSSTDDILNSEGVSMLSLNVQSLQAKFADLSELIHKLNTTSNSPDIITLQEIWRLPNLTEFKILNYQNIFANSRKEAQGGGVAIYIKNGHSFIPDQALSIFHDRVYETIVGTVKLSNKKSIIVGSTYRPGTKHPNMSITDQNDLFLELLSNQLELLSSKKQPVYLFGDFNIDVLKYGTEPLVNDYIELLYSAGFIQSIIRPTRCTPRSATLIDHVLTNDISGSHVSRILTTNISDHFPILYVLKSGRVPCENKKIQCRDFSNRNIETFKNNLQNINWDVLMDYQDVDDSYNYFLDNFIDLFNMFFPIKTITPNKNIHPKEPWFSNGLLKSRSEKQRLDRLAATIPSVENISKFKKYRNVYNTLIRAAKKIYYEKKLKDCQSNAKATWQTIKNITNIKSKKNKIETFVLNIGNNQLTDSKQIAQAFNEFFAAAPHLISQNINKTSPFFHSFDPGGAGGPTFDLLNKPISHDEIFTALNLLEPKKTSDLHGVSMFLLKKCCHQIYIPLSHIFNLSFNTGKFPTKMKTAKVIPIHKGGDTASPDNYRPISLLSSFSKILEKIFSIRITDFLEHNNIISESQFGFRKGHSTAHPMVLLDNYVSEALNKKHHTIAVFCDLRKAFDTVNHGILLRKLRRCGITGLALSWLKSYLTGRQQFVFFNECSSSLLEICLGVPQGSILGPLLFLIYINDLPNISALKTFLFADDATLLASHADPEELCRIINTELKKVTDYFRDNLLAIHPAKTKFIVFSQSRNLDPDQLKIFIDNNNEDQIFNPQLKYQISRVTGESDDQAIRFLGLYVDPQLNYKYHVQQIIKKVSSALFVMRKSKNLLTKKALTLLYYSLVHSHIIYAIQIWSSCSSFLINKIFKLQKQAIRIINSAPYNAHWT